MNACHAHLEEEEPGVPGAPPGAGEDVEGAALTVSARRVCGRDAAPTPPVGAPGYCLGACNQALAVLQEHGTNHCPCIPDAQKASVNQR